MRILIDCRFAVKLVGLGRYTRNIVPSFITATEHDVYLVVSNKDTLDWLPKHLHSKCIPTSVRHYTIAEQMWLPILILKHNIDCFWSLHFNIPVLTTARTVCTIHDLILHHYPNTESRSKRLLYKALLFIAVHKCALVIAVSTTTYSDLCRTYGSKIQPKLQHITEAIEDDFVPTNKEETNAILQSYTLKRPYILYVGNDKQHKNVANLIQGFITANVPELSLVLVCDSPGLKTKYAQHSFITFVSKIDNTALRALYTGAEAFITASYYEGFCLPILEARACNVRILASNTLAIKELADEQNDTLLFEPTISGVANAILALQSMPHTKSTKGCISWQIPAKQIALLPFFYGSHSKHS